MTTITHLFPLGQIVITVNAANTLRLKALTHGLRRHAEADWGDIDMENWDENRLALTQGGRLRSAYGDGDERFWIITEADRQLTTVLTPEELSA
jgi:hypothetical protein